MDSAVQTCSNNTFLILQLINLRRILSASELAAALNKTRVTLHACAIIPIIPSVSVNREKSHFTQVRNVRIITLSQWLHRAQMKYWILHYNSQWMLRDHYESLISFPVQNRFRLLTHLFSFCLCFYLLDSLSFVIIVIIK